MPKWIKVSIGIFAALIIFLSIGGMIIYNMLKQSLPEYSGELRVSSISADVEIYRDSLGIPYVLAQSDEDAAFALGFLHAQERLFQMDLVRRAGEGRLSEIFGSRTLAFDKLFRTVGIKKRAEENLSLINPISRKMLEAYSNGVNYYIKSALGKYPIEFDILGYQPYEWEPVHSLIVIRMMAWELNISWWEDVAFTHIIQKLGGKAKDIIPQYPENAPTIIPSELKKYPPVDLSLINTDRVFRQFMGITGTHIGSNSWAVNSLKSVSGKPIIANDPHLAYSAPGKWYFAVFRSPAYNVEGVTLPGVPAVVIGKNKSIAWALTNVMTDDADFYLEKLDPSKMNYWFRDAWNKMNIYRDTIRVHDSSDVILEIKSTHRGPVISDVHLYDELYPSNRERAVLSMKWTGNDFSDEYFAFYTINKASNWDEFKKGVQLFNVPGQNFIYADHAGNIGYICGAKLPVRENAGLTLIFDGTADKYDWKGYVPFNEMPMLFNSSSNYVASANNKTIENFKYHISNLWEPSSRIERIKELLNSKEKHSTKDFKDYQTDFKSPHARKITKYILNAFNGIEITDKNLKLAVELLSKWNFEFSEYSQTPAVYAVFLNKLIKNIYYDELGDVLFNEYVFVPNVPYRNVLELMEKPGSEWWDNTATARRESKDEIIRQSLSDALSELENQFGLDMKEWQWGRLHHVRFKHSFSGTSALLDKFLNIGPFSVGGDGTTLFNTEYSFHANSDYLTQFSSKPFDNILGPSMRYIYDFANPDEIYFVHTTGQSGNVLSPHYKDMAELWLRGSYIKIRTDLESIRSKNNKLLIMNRVQ